jgi:hypothetical protein
MTSLAQYIHTKPGLSFAGKNDQQIVVLPLSKLVASDGCLFHAQQNAVYVAEKGATGFAQRGSIGLARAGAKIYGSGGAIIFAEKGAWVRATDGDTVYHEAGAEVVPTSGASVIQVPVVATQLFFAPEMLIDVPQPQAL